MVVAGIPDICESLRSENPLFILSFFNILEKFDILSSHILRINSLTMYDILYIIKLRDKRDCFKFWKVITITKPRISVNRESQTGRNETFHDNFTGRNMNREQFVKSIKKGNYENYHVRVINGIETPVSNPDISANNNLG